MSNQETYDRTLDAPALPDEPYYRPVRSPQPGSRRAGLGIALLLVGLILLASQLFGQVSWFGGGTTTLVDQTLSGSRIELSTTSADVHVATWSGPGIRVEAIQRGGSRGDYTVNVSQSGDIVRVTEANRGPFWCLFCSRDLNYQISVPAGAQAAITTASGDVDVAGLAGPVTLGTVSGDVRAESLAGGLAVETTSGDVRLSDVAGQLSVGTISGEVKLEDGQVDGATVKTTSGDVELAGVAGALSVSTVSGEIDVSGARDGRLTLATTSGDIGYDGELARGGTSQISSISGDVKLALPASSGFRLDASTVSGELRSDFDLQGGVAQRRSLTGVAGDGAATLNVSTTSGEIHIERH